VSGGIAKKPSHAIKKRGAKGGVEEREKIMNRHSTGQGRKRLAIPGKSESLRQSEPDSLIEAVR